MLKITNIKLGLSKVNKEDAVKRAGEMLRDSGYVDEHYIAGMLKREEAVSTYLAHHVAIPHGEAEVKNDVKKTGIVVLQYPEGIDYGNGETVKLIIGIAAKNDEHLEIIAKLANILDDEEKAEKLVNTESVDYIYRQLK